MRPRLFGLFVTAVLLGAAGTAQERPGGATRTGCDRACLAAFVDQYLEALTAHDAFGLPLAGKVRFSENDQLLPIGDGLWNTATGVGAYKIYALDPTRGQAAFVGTVRENDAPAFLSVRLKIDGGRISEIETLVQRLPSGPGNAQPLAARLENGTPDAALLETVPTAERVSRDALLAAANTEIDAIEHDEDRTIYPRRFTVIDEEHQVVFGSFIVQEPGDPSKGTVPSFSNTTQVLRVRRGRVAARDGVTVSLPYGTPTPFFDGDWRKGNRTPLSLPAQNGTSGSARLSAAIDRASLQGIVDRYLSALVAHDPRQLPFSPSVRFSENDVPLRLGDALWRTASAVGTYKLYFADPQTGQVGFFGTIRENGKPAALVLRLRLESGLITEVETLVIRNEGTANNLEKSGTPDPVLLETVPTANRLSRAALIATTNTYFEAIEQGNGAVGAFDPECNRFENGTKTSGTQGCSAQLDTHIFDYIQKIYPRRFLIVDEERQTVFGFFMFTHPGDIVWVNVPGQGRREMPAAAKRPFNVDVAELFRIKDKKIRKVEALMVSLPYGARSPFVPQQ